MQQQRYIKNILFIFVILFCFIVVAMMFYLRESIFRPIRKLLFATKILAAGDLNYSIPEVSNDELGELSHEFNAMSRSILAANEKLKNSLENLSISEHKFRESENRIHEILEHAHSIIFLKDIKGRYTLVNQAFENLLGRSRRNIIGVTDHELFAEDIALHFSNTDRVVLESGEAVESEDMLPDLNSSMHYYTTVKFPLFNENREIYALCGFATDVTGQREAKIKLNSFNKELEQQVQQRTAELTVVNKELEAFAYSIAHDLSSPLRAIDGFSHVLLSEYDIKFDEEGEHYLSQIRRSAQHMGDIIQALLKLSRISRNNLVLEMVNLSDIANSIIENYCAAEPGRKVSVCVATELKVRADKKLMLLLLENIIANAWKYSSKSSITSISIGSELRSNETVYFIKDKGCGFDTQYMDKLFLPFQRLHNVSEYSGSGVGLATAARIIQRHNGKIWAESEVGKGASIFFTLQSDKDEPDRKKLFFPDNFAGNKKEG